MPVPAVQETITILPTANIFKQSNWCCGLRCKRVAKLSASFHVYKRAPYETGIPQRAVDRGIWAGVSYYGIKGWSGGGCRGWATMTRSCVHFQMHPKELRGHLSYSCSSPAARVSEVCGIHPDDPCKTGCGACRITAVGPLRGDILRSKVFSCVYQYISLWHLFHSCMDYIK